MIPGSGSSEGPGNVPKSIGGPAYLGVSLNNDLCLSDAPRLSLAVDPSSVCPNRDSIVHFIYAILVTGILPSAYSLWLQSARF